MAGPQDQLYFLGCRLDAMYPLGPIIAGAGLWDLADAFPVALKELMNSSEATHGRT